jgi:phage terminase small subunit
MTIRYDVSGSTLIVPSRYVSTAPTVESEAEEPLRHRGKKNKGYIQPISRTRLADASVLTDKERIFCAEYLANNMEATKAFDVAFPGKRKSNGHAYVTQLLKKPSIRAYLGSILQARLERAGLTAERILHRLECAIFLDPLDLYQPGDVDGVYELKPLDEIPREARRCITKCKTRVRETECGMDVTTEIEFMSKDKAVELAMKYLGLLRETNVSIHMKGQAQAIDFDKLCEPPDDNDIVEGKIESVIELPALDEDNDDSKDLDLSVDHA